MAAGSKRLSTNSATVPLKWLIEANSSGAVVSRSNHHAGCSAPSAKVRSDSVGGIVSPLRTSRSRRPATGVSTVSTSAS